MKTCPYCKKEIETGTYHLECEEKWKKTLGTCPICNKFVTSRQHDCIKNDFEPIRTADSTVKSLKFDEGKLRYDLIPPEWLKAIAEVLTYGCVKYKENSWQGIERYRYIGATFRHFTAWLMGEKYDPESKLHHLAHAAVNILFLFFKDNHNIV